MGYIGYFTVVDSREIINSPYNPRLDSMADRVVRGKILDRNGNVLAETDTAEDGSEYRYYPYGEIFAHVVGYSTQGKSGLESTENFDLLTSNAFILEKLKREFQDQKNIGDNVVTTLDADLQSSAYYALGDNKGAVIVIEPSTGKILAMVSKPSYDPNSVVADWDWLNSDEDSILLNRATQGMYAPGSTFKIVTALEYMREHPNDYSAYTYECVGEITYGDATIPCANHAVHGGEDLAASFANSCNASFCNIGMNLDVSQYRKTASELLIGSKLPGDFAVSKSRFLLDKNDSVAEKMMTAMGQGKTQVSPYQMALITAAVANGGSLMRPYLVDSVTNYTGTIISETTPEKYKDLMTSSEAAQLKAYMADVVNYGTGSVLSGQAYSAAGKTGTAEYSMDSSDQTHSWFVGFTNVDNPELVISVIVEESNGNTRAVDVAKQIFDSYYY
ncbi:MAG: penicillin-binding transpeptidase domain-containing protein [Eubacteriales bacterium]|nr:penicillin-binding transpeptidase domain-containing protein [Eubacteriales bacterium]